MPSASRQRLEIVWLAVLFEGGLAVLAWIVGWLTGLRPLARIHWNGWDALLGVAACVPLLLIFYLCIRWPVGPLARIKAFSEQVIRPLFRYCGVLDFAVISLLAGLGEEMLFRAVLQDFLVEKLNGWLGLIIASALFGLLHLITPTYAVLAGVMGAYLGWVWMRTDNLLVVMIAHGLYDFLALLYLVRWLPRQGGVSYKAECEVP
jgi:membrane protease YdiL (CAAX protease family)